ncbi:MAG: LamG domain-containing protein [Pirellulales bacterium]
MKTSVVLAFFGLILSALSGTSQAALVAHWNFNQATGNLLDISGNGQIAVPSVLGLTYGSTSVPAGTYGALTVDAATAAAFGNSMTFNRALGGNLTVVATPALESLIEPLGGSMTIMAWVKTDTLPSATSYRIFTTGLSSGWSFGMANVDRIQFSNALTAQVSTGTVTTNAGWHHVAVTINGTAGTMYADGNVVGTFSTGLFIDELLGIYTIGGNGLTDFFGGQLDELKIFNTPLVQADVRLNALPQATAVPEPATWAVGAWVICLFVLFKVRRDRSVRMTVPETR